MSDKLAQMSKCFKARFRTQSNNKIETQLVKEKILKFEIECTKNAPLIFQNAEDVCSNSIVAVIELYYFDTKNMIN